MLDRDVGDERPRRCRGRLHLGLGPRLRCEGRAACCWLHALRLLSELPPCATVVQILTKDKRVRARTLARRAATVNGCSHLTMREPESRSTAHDPPPHAADAGRCLCRRCRRLGAAVRRARQRLLPGSAVRPFRRRALLQSGRHRAQGTGRLPQVAVRRAGRGVAGELPEPVPAGPAAGALRRRRRAHRPRRARELPDPDARARSVLDRSGLGRAREPVLVSSGPSASTRPASPSTTCPRSTPCSSPTTTTTTWTWRRSGGCGSASARASSRRSATTPSSSSAVPGLDAERRRLGRRGRSRRRPQRARRADAALVGARRRRPHARAVGELRRARRATARSTASATPASATARTFARVRRAPSGPRAGAAADRRLRAALVHAQQPHEPGGGRARRWQLCGAAPGARPPLGHVPPHQRGRRRAAEDSAAALAERAIPPERFPALQARRRACRGLTGTRADERGGERATPSAEWRIAVIVSAFSSAHSLVP